MPRTHSCSTMPLVAFRMPALDIHKVFPGPARVMSMLPPYASQIGSDSGCATQARAFSFDPLCNARFSRRQHAHRWTVTTVSWIPSESVSGALYRVPFEMGLCHYNPHQTSCRTSTPCSSLMKLDSSTDCRPGSTLRTASYQARPLRTGLIGSTTLRLGRHDLRFAAIALPDRRRAERVGTDAVRFEQTAGGRTGVPAPRRVTRPPFVELVAPVAWTTLRLTMYADGTQYFELAGASSFPRHWVYDGGDRLALSRQQWTTSGGAPRPSVDTPRGETPIHLRS